MRVLLSMLCVLVSAAGVIIAFDRLPQEPLNGEIGGAIARLSSIMVHPFKEAANDKTVTAKGKHDETAETCSVFVAPDAEIDGPERTTALRISSVYGVVVDTTVSVLMGPVDAMKKAAQPEIPEPKSYQPVRQVVYEMAEAPKMDPNTEEEVKSLYGRIHALTAHFERKTNSAERNGIGELSLTEYSEIIEELYQYSSSLAPIVLRRFKQGMSSAELVKDLRETFLKVQKVKTSGRRDESSYEGAENTAEKIAQALQRAENFLNINGLWGVASADLREYRV